MSWADQALCREVGAEFFYPDIDIEDLGGKGQGQTRAFYNAAKRVCARCPVQQPCLDEALERGDRFGVFGGMTPPERQALQRVDV